MPMPAIRPPDPAALHAAEIRFAQELAVSAPAWRQVNKALRDQIRVQRRLIGHDIDACETAGRETVRLVRSMMRMQDAHQNCAEALSRLRRAGLRAARAKP